MVFHQLELTCGTHKASVWAQIFVAVPNLPSPSEWGSVQATKGGWKVKWTALPEAVVNYLDVNARKAAGSTR